jgi:hypothetical protein
MDRCRCSGHPLEQGQLDPPIDGCPVHGRNTRKIPSEWFGGGLLPTEPAPKGPLPNAINIAYDDENGVRVVRSEFADKDNWAAREQAVLKEDHRLDATYRYNEEMM